MLLLPDSSMTANEVSSCKTYDYSLLLLGFACIAAKHSPLHSAHCGVCYASMSPFLSFVLVPAFALFRVHLVTNPHAQQLTHELVTCSTAMLACIAMTNRSSDSQQHWFADSKWYCCCSCSSMACTAHQQIRASTSCWAERIAKQQHSSAHVRPSVPLQ